MNQNKLKPTDVAIGNLWPSSIKCRNKRQQNPFKLRKVHITYFNITCSNSRNHNLASDCELID